MKPLPVPSLIRHALGGAALLALTASALADDILLHEGRPITGVRVEGETYKEVDYVRGGGAKATVDASNVKSITYGRTSPEYQQGLSSLAAGEAAMAAGYFLTAADDESLPDFIRATARIEAADALLSSGHLPEAMQQYDKLLTAQSDTRHLARALFGKGRAQFFSRQFGQAESTFQKLKADAQSAGLGERWALEADFFLLWSQEAQGRSVLDDYRDLRARTRGAYPSIANRASLRMGRVHLGAGELDEARRYFDEIIDSRVDTDEEVVAGAYLGRGRCLFQAAQNLQGSGQADPDEIRDAYETALLDFLRVHVRYGGVSKEQAEALYWAGVCFLNVASFAMGAEANELKTNGDILLKRCRDRHPESEWATKAAAEQ